MKKNYIHYQLLLLGAIGFTLASCSTKYRVKVQDDKKIYNLKYGESRQQNICFYSGFLRKGKSDRGYCSRGWLEDRSKGTCENVTEISS